jgi:hypothetical protein
MRCFAASAVAISTPASAYFMDEVRSRFPFDRPVAGRTQLFLMIARWVRR